MSKVTAGWKRASLYDPATGTIVQFNHLSASASSWDSPNINSETSTGLLHAHRNPQAVIGFFDSDDLAQLATWAEAGTILRAAIEGLVQNVLWKVSEEVQFERGVTADARSGAEIHQINIQTISDFSEIEELVNLAESGDFTTDPDSFVFPIEGATITAAGTYSGGPNGNLVITAKNYAGATLGTSTQALSNGLVSTSLDLPANTYTVEVEFLNASTVGTVTDKTIRTDGKTAYVAY